MSLVRFVDGPLNGRLETIPVFKDGPPTIIEFGFVPTGAILNGHDDAALDRLTELAGIYRWEGAHYEDGALGRSIVERYVWQDWRPPPA